jgi:hypothetical protein
MMPELIETALEDIFYQWCSDVTGIQFIIANQHTGPYRPRPLYGTIHLLNFDGTQLNEVMYEDIFSSENVNQIVRIRPKVMVSVNIYGDGGKTQVVRLKSSVWSTPTIEFFEENCVGFVEHSTIRSMPRLTHEDHENRAQCDFTFNLIGDYINELNTIGRIEIENKLDDSEIIVED